MDTVTIVGGFPAGHPEVNTVPDCCPAREGIMFVLTAQMQVKIMHLGALSYDLHKVLGDLYAALDPLVDEFCELSLSDQMRSAMRGDFSTSFTADASVALSSLQQHVECLSKLPTDRRDINAVVDQMIAAYRRTMYLLTFS